MVYPSDLKLEVKATGLMTYPDLMVVCGKPEFVYDHGDVLRNPVVIFEVLSESTESFDRGKKFEHYRLIPSLRHYVLVSQDRCSVEVFTRQVRENQAVDPWLLS
ncbi:MAG: Uma2 family endonuclease [Planctomycetaceae bacterium]|nr:Uma2 family endonuclease [Planctomycetaceae bacterium]